MNQDNVDKESIRQRYRRQQEEAARSHEDAKIAVGIYYTTFDHLWQRDAETFDSSHFTMFLRSRPPMFLESSAVGKPKHNSFLETINGANNPENALKDDGISARTSHPDDTRFKKEIWSCNILQIPIVTIQTAPRSSSGFGFRDSLLQELPIVPQNEHDYKRFKAPDALHPNYNETDDDDTSHSGTEDDKIEIWGFKILQVPAASHQTIDRMELTSAAHNDDVPGEIAHLVPASPRYASLYYDVAKWVFGKEYAQSNVSYFAIQKLIHGAEEDMLAQKVASTNKKRRSMGGVRTGKTKSAGGNRLPHTGLKHLVCNKIRISGQKEHFDDEAQVLIVPILTAEEACAWNGGSYSAIFMIAAKPGKFLWYVAFETSFQKKIDQASEDEIEKARQLLAAIVKGLAYSLTNMNCQTAPFLDERHLEVVGALQRMQAKDGTVIVPSAIAPPNCRVGKVTFWPQGTAGGHPAPDPILLATKAGVNWSKFFGFQLLPTGEPNEHDALDDPSANAEGEYLQWVNGCQRVKEYKQQMNDILGMTVATDSH